MKVPSIIVAFIGPRATDRECFPSIGIGQCFMFGYWSRHQSFALRYAYAHSKHVRISEECKMRVGVWAEWHIDLKIEGTEPKPIEGEREDAFS